MNPEEYERLDRIDRRHWFYCGKRTIVRHWIDRYSTPVAEDLLVDVGCGTGAFLLSMARQCRVIGVDDHPESVALARPRVEAAGGSVLEAGYERIELPDGCAALVTALDVVEHIDDDRAAIAELSRLCRPGGLIVLTVPALPALWSDWDEALHHRRRYRRRELLDLVSRPELEVLRCTYFNTALLPAIAAVRMARKLRPPARTTERAEDRLPPRWLNALLYWLMVVPARWTHLPPIPGVSLLAVLRRRPDP